MTWEQYLLNLANAGASGAVTALMASAIGLTPKQIAMLGLTSFLFSAGKWYLQHKPPGVTEE